MNTQDNIQSLKKIIDADDLEENLINIFFLNEVLTCALKYSEEKNLTLDGGSYFSEEIQHRLKKCLEYF